MKSNDLIRSWFRKTLTSEDCWIPFLHRKDVSASYGKNKNYLIVYHKPDSTGFIIISNRIIQTQKWVKEGIFLRVWHCMEISHIWEGPVISLASEAHVSVRIWNSAPVELTEMENPRRACGPARVSCAVQHFWSCSTGRICTTQHVLGNNLLPLSSKNKFQNYFKALWQGKEAIALEQMICFALKNGVK